MIGVPVQVYAKLRSGDDYGVTVITKNAPQTLSIRGVNFTFWGVPADPSHDAERFCDRRWTKKGTKCTGCSSEAPLRPFLTLPTSCVGRAPTTRSRPPSK